MDNIKQELVETKFAIGAVVKHRFLDFRGVIVDVDPEFNSNGNVNFKYKGKGRYDT